MALIKREILTSRKVVHTYCHANTPLGESEGAYYLSICSHVREIERERVHNILILLAEKANSLKRLSKACLILGDTVKSADFANRALKIYKETHGNMMQHREVCD